MRLNGRGTRIATGGACFGFGRTRAFFRLFGDFRLHARCFFNAERFHAHRFEARGFSSGSFLCGRGFSGSFRGSGSNRGLFFGSSLDVGGLSAATHRLRARGDGSGRSGRGGFGRDSRSGRSPATGSRGRRGLLFRANAFFSLPPCTDASNLVVREHTHMAANGNVHGPKKCGHFVGGHSEFVGQLTD
jgi:hypothetical protein